MENNTLYDILDVNKLPKELEKPINIKLFGNEEIYYISPVNISTKNKISIFDFFMKTIMSGNVEEREIYINETIETLDEKEYNAKIGYAKEKRDGSTNIGHANRELLIKSLSNELIYNFFQNNKTFNRYAIFSESEKKNAANKFMSFLIDFLYEQEGISTDTIGDFILSLELPNILRYTKKIYFEMKNQNIECKLTKKGSILYKGMKLILIPSSWVSDSIYHSKNESKIPFSLVGMELMLLKAAHKHVAYKMLRKNEIHKTLITRTLNKLMEYNWNEAIEKMSWSDSYYGFVETLSGKKTISLFQEDEMIISIKEWFSNHKTTYISA